MVSWPISMVTLDLALPPSINCRVAKLGNQSPEVRAWIKDSDARLMAARYRPPTFSGDVAVQIIWDERRRGDADNRLKCTSSLYGLDGA
jgi:hypothetical protein